MTKFSRLVTIAGLAGTLLTGTAFAQSAATGAMSSGDHMANGSMSSMSHGHGQMSSGAMAAGDHMKTKHTKSKQKMKWSKHGKKSGRHMTPGAMTSGH